MSAFIIVFLGYMLCAFRFWTETCRQKKFNVQAGQISVTDLNCNSRLDQVKIFLNKWSLLANKTTVMAFIDAKRTGSKPKLQNLYCKSV